ncbi:hypothetical protein BD410DRAFT_797163 [Rickenella mellea]|uniref:Uncharacterized protein n=1 Tax=Rickenella mellea TaxID=50990 RepID=A0A4Y7PGQ4_9AGAM|nr:hypothetical protein BD410DRAFT_797163 [Rickenella mellea]
MCALTFEFRNPYTDIGSAGDLRIINEGESRDPDVNACLTAMNLEASGCSIGWDKNYQRFPVHA